MKLLTVNIRVFEGGCPFGGVADDQETTLEISDEEAGQLIALIKSNNGEVDQVVLEEIPQLSERLYDEGCRIYAEYCIVEEYEDGNLDDIEEDDDDHKELTREEILDRYGDLVDSFIQFGCHAQFVITEDCIS